MSDEKVPPPDPSAAPAPPPTEGSVTPPTEPSAPVENGSPPVPIPTTEITPKAPEIPAVDRPTPAFSAQEAPAFKRSMGRLVVGWILAVVTFLVVANFFSFMVTAVTGVQGFGVIAYVLTFIAFVVLDQDLWLSKVFGINTTPHTSPLRSVLYFLTFGWLAYLFVGRGPQVGTTEAAASKSASPLAKPEGKPHDVFREVAETVVFVVVLVLLLKTFIAEAFVIPTGSMATTLWGYQKPVTCPECAFNFPVNCSSQVDPSSASDREDVIGCTCPNCRLNIYFHWTSPQIMPHILRQWNEDETHRPMIDDPPWHSGDRVLVAKFLYESGLRKPARHDVVVFKYPDGPQRNQTAMNYIKRLIGKPSETIGIHAGDVYAAAIAYPEKTDSVPEDLRALRKDMREDEAHNTFKDDVVKPMADPNRKFQIIRKSPEVLLALARPVYNNDHQPTDLAGLNMPRWYADKGWKPDAPMFPKKFAAEPAGDEVQWLRYRHLLRDPANRKLIDAKPQLITDFMGYNTAMTPRGQKPSGQNWVGDLILETEVQLDKAAKGDELWLELSKGIDRFQARFDLDSGACTLVRKTGAKETVLGQKDTAVKGAGAFRLRLANVDERLTLWVNDALPFGDGQPYDPPTTQGPDPEKNPAKNNDLQPASIAVKGKPGLSVAKLQLGRDTYYTVNVEYSRADGEVPPGGWGDPNAWGKLRELPYKTLYVQPEHYLCMGDNSPESSDGRAWGLVPDRLLLGRALLVYFPFKPFGAETRVGVIK